MATQMNFADIINGVININEDGSVDYDEEYENVKEQIKFIHELELKIINQLIKGKALFTTLLDNNVVVKIDAFDGLWISVSINDRVVHRIEFMQHICDEYDNEPHDCKKLAKMALAYSLCMLNKRDMYQKYVKRYAENRPFKGWKFYYYEMLV